MGGKLLETALRLFPALVVAAGVIAVAVWLLLRVSRSLHGALAAAGLE